MFNQLQRMKKQYGTLGAFKYLRFRLWKERRQTLYRFTMPLDPSVAVDLGQYPYRVVEAEPQYLERMLADHPEECSPEKTRELAERRADGGCMPVLALDEAGQIVGYCSYCVKPGCEYAAPFAPTETFDAYLLDMFVFQQWRRTKVCEFLVQVCLHEFLNRNKKHIYVVINDFNTASQSFVLKWGFRRQSRIKARMENGRLTITKEHAI